MMTHTALHWPDDNTDNIRLWAFAATHAAWPYSQMPNKNLGWLSPSDIFTKTQSDHRDLLRARVWGCPVFVLHHKLQDGQKIPKFNRRSCMGQFLGFRDETVSTIQNDTRLEDTTVEQIFNDLFETCKDYYGEEGRPPEGTVQSDPPPHGIRWGVVD